MGLIQIVKGGGTTCKDAQTIDNFAQIIVEKHVGHDGIDSVVALASAPGKVGPDTFQDKVTNLLEMVYFNENKDEALSEINRRVARIVTDLNLNGEVGDYVLDRFSELRSAADEIQGQFNRDQSGIKNTELYARICSFGERINGKILSEHIKKKYGLDTVFLDVFDLGMETEGAWDDARPTHNTKRLIREALQQHGGKLVVTTPFLGYKLIEGEKRITCVGRGGSDWSATYVGEIVGASDAFIYSDKAGLLRADPGLFEIHAPDPIRVISYREALEFASLGASIILDRAIKPAQRSRMKVHILDSGDVSAGGTVIQYEPHHPGVKALATVEGYRRLIVRGTEQASMDRPGATGAVMSLFGEHGMNVKGHVDHGTGADTYFFAPHPAMGAVEFELHKRGYQLTAHSPLTRLTIIGEGMSDRDCLEMQRTLVDNSIAVRGQLFGGESDITRTAFVSGEDGHLATMKLYSAFFSK